MESELLVIDGVDDDLLAEELIEEKKNKFYTTTPLLDLDLDDSLIDFSCSPLVIDRPKCSVDRPRIPRPEVKGKGEEMQKSTNKENHSEENVGSTTSPGSSHTMKRRKRGGGFNLRKSLAWNKAFFTEEGVLDPLELSRLSHSFSKPNTEFLSVVPEEGRTAMIKGSRVCGGGSPLQTLQEDMLSELRAKSANENKRSLKNRSPVALPSIRERAASGSPASRKLQLTKSPYKSVSSGGGCPRPSGSSSQKRLPNASAIRSSMKESKLPRRTVLKPEASLISATSKNIVAGAKRCNQKTLTGNTERNGGINGHLNKTKTASGLTSSSLKSTALHLGKNMASKGSSSGLKQTADPVRRADTSVPIEDGCRKVAVSLPQNAYSGNKNVPAQSQPTKPSGLRMPSPSIGYFGQSKTSASHSIQSLRNTQSSNIRESGIPNPRKLGHPNQIGAALPGTSKLTKGTDTKVRASSSSSMSKCLIPSIAATTSQPPLKSKTQLKNPEVEAIATSFKSVYKNISSQAELHSIDDVESGKLEVARNIAHDEGEQIFQENRKLGVNDVSLLVHSKSFEHLQEDSKLESIMDVSQKTEKVSGSELGSEHVPVSLNSRIQVEDVVLADNMIEHNHEENVQVESLNSNMLIGDHRVMSNVKFCDDNGVDNSVVHVKGLRDTQPVNEISGELLEVIKPVPESLQNFTFDIEQIQNEGDKRPHISECILIKDQGVSEGSQDIGSSVHAARLGFSAHHVNEKCGVLADLVKPVLVEVGEIQHTENETLLISDIILIEQGGFSEEVQKDNDNSGVTTSVVHAESLGLAHYGNEEHGEIQHKENEGLQISDTILMEQEGFSEESQKDNGNSGVTTTVVHAESSGFAYVYEESGIQAEAENPLSDEVEPILCMNQQLHLPDSTFVEQRRLSEESHDIEKSILATHVSTSTEYVENFGFAHHVNEKSGVLTEVIKPKSDEQIQHMENQRLHSLVEQQELSEEPQEDNDNAIIGSLVGTSMRDVENLGFAHHANEEAGELAEIVKPGSDEVEQVQHMEDMQLHLADRILMVQQGLSEESHDVDDNTVAVTCVDASMVRVEKSGNLSEAVKPSSNVAEELPKDDHNTLVLQSRSSGESQEDNDIGNIINVRPKTLNSGGSSCKKSHILSQLEINRQVKDGDAGNDNIIDHHPVENQESLNDTQCEHPINDSAEGTLGLMSCPQLSKQTSDTMTCNIKLDSSPLLVLTSSANTLDHIDGTVSKDYISLEKTETDHSPSNEIPGDEQCESENAVSPMKCADPTLSAKRSSSGYSNHDALTLKYKIKAVPFSDEWLAAMEAAGEDILTMKSGAVQNSPTDKSLPEPSPWSPVKKKNQEIGPFDCTKCTNLTPPNIP